MRICLTLALSFILAIPAFAQPPGGGRGRGGMMNMSPSMLLGNKSVQEELKITEEQATKFKEFNTKLNADRPMRDPNGDPDEQAKKRAEFQKMSTEKTEKFVKETLTEDQAKRLKQIALQLGGISAAVNNEETAKTLKITDEQKTSIKEINDNMMKDMRELFTPGSPPDADSMKKITALRKEAADKAKGVLTDDQKKMWTEMTGKPFEIKMEQRPGGNRPNPPPA